MTTRRPGFDERSVPSFRFANQPFAPALGDTGRTGNEGTALEVRDHQVRNRAQVQPAAGRLLDRKPEIRSASTPRRHMVQNGTAAQRAARRGKLEMEDQ